MIQKLKVGDRVVCTVLHGVMSGQSGEITNIIKMNCRRKSYLVRFDSTREEPFMAHELEKV